MLIKSADKLDAMEWNLPDSKLWAYRLFSSGSLPQPLQVTQLQIWKQDSELHEVERSLFSTTAWIWTLEVLGILQGFTSQ